MKKMLNTAYLGSGLGLGMDMGQGINLLYQMAHNIDESRRQKEQEEAGIIFDGKFWGVTDKIQHIYNGIKFQDGYFYCFLDGKLIVHNIQGTPLFTCAKAQYCEQGMFLVGNEPENYDGREEYGYSLYNENIEMTKPIFRNGGSMGCGKFNDFGFSTFSLFGKSTSVAVNKKGEILFESSIFDHLYIRGVILLTKDSYINLLTNEVICKKGYNSTLDTKEFIFVQDGDNCVYQINKEDGTHQIHGVKPEVKEPVKHSPAPKKADEPKIKPQGRNEKCACGSGKKYKQCCMNK